MGEPVISPRLARRAGNSELFIFERKFDPARLAFQNWNQGLVLGGSQPSGPVKPTQDGRAYRVEGSRHRYSRPFVRVARQKGWQEGPEVRFLRDEDGLWLTAIFEEDHERRVANTLPFDVRVTSVHLRYGSEVLEFEELLQAPLPDPMEGPAFRIEVKTLVPEDGRHTRLIRAMQAIDTTRWEIGMEFDWEVPDTSPTPDAGSPRPRLNPAVVRPNPRFTATLAHRPLLSTAIANRSVIQPRVMAPLTRVSTNSITARDAVFLRAETARPVATMVARPEALATIDLRNQVREALSANTISNILDFRLVNNNTPEVETIKIPPGTRRETAHYPDGFAENDRIYAAVTGNYTHLGWRNSAHGWYQPTLVQDTVYTLPDAYRLELDSTTGLPAILPLLRLDENATDDDGVIDPEDLRVRLSMRVAPVFDADRLTDLRDFVRGVSHQVVKWADLVLGGYSRATFIPDESLEDIGELIGGADQANESLIDAEGGFTLTYEGSTEFFALLVDRLKTDGIRGRVELELIDETNTTQTHTVPVVLTLRQTRPLRLNWQVIPPPLDEDGNQGVAQLIVTNPTSRVVHVARLRTTALLLVPTTRQVSDYRELGVNPVNEPILFNPGQTRTFPLEPGELEPGRPFPVSAWHVNFYGVTVQNEGVDAVLHNLFDIATASVRGWRIEVDCPPLEFFDQLPPEDQAPFRNVVAVEVELRRTGSPTVVDLRLTKAQPRGELLLSRSLTDFLDDASGANRFEYRRRLIRISGLDAWSGWREARGSSVSVFFA